MVNIEKIDELINKVEYIKSKFTIKNYDMGASYDFKNKQRKIFSVPIETIYQNTEFISWKEQLIYEIGQLQEDSFTTEIIKLLSRFKGFGDKNNFEKLEAKLYVLKEHLNEYKEIPPIIEIFDERIPEKELDEKISRALLKLQRNYNYNSSSSEDIMNDYVRDILDENYVIKDQSRQGKSENGDNAGEVDIQICSDGFPVVMIEGIKLAALSKEYLDKHINKILTKYDPNGCPYAFILVYTTVYNFDSFYDKLQKYLKDYNFPYQCMEDIIDVDTGYAELKHSHTVLKRNEKNIRVHFYVAHIV